MPPRSCHAFLLALLLTTSPVLGYDLAETDGDDQPGNAPILLGWEATRFPLGFSIDEEAPAVTTPPELRQAVLNAWSSWQTASQGHVGFLEVAAPGGAGVTTAVVDASIGIADCQSPSDCSHLVVNLDTNWANTTAQSSATVAVTILKFEINSRRIVDADILINSENHQFEVSGDPTRFDLEGVVVHECGHVLGIGHPKSAERTTSTMWPETQLGALGLRSLEQDDTNAVLYLYAPLEMAVPGPDNNLLGLIQRAVVSSTGGSSGGGCRALPGAPVDPLGLLGLLLAITLTLSWRGGSSSRDDR